MLDASAVLLTFWSVLRKVLQEVRASSDPQELHAVADSEDRQACRKGPASQVQILVLFLGRCDHGRGVGLSQPQTLGIKIVAPGEEQAIDPPQKGVPLFW